MLSLSTVTPIGALQIQSNGSAIISVSWRKFEDPHQKGSIDSVCRAAANELQAYFAQDLREFTVPLALSGSPLQLRVWSEPYTHNRAVPPNSRRRGQAGWFFRRPGLRNQSLFA